MSEMMASSPGCSPRATSTWSKLETPRVTGVRTARSRKAGRDEAADRGLFAETWRFAGDHLAFLAQGSLDMSEARTGAHGDDELGGVVIDNAFAGGRVEHIAGERLSVKILGAAAADAKRRAGSDRRANARLPARDDGFCHCAPAAPPAERDASLSR